MNSVKFCFYCLLFWSAVGIQICNADYYEYDYDYDYVDWDALINEEQTTQAPKVITGDQFEEMSEFCLLPSQTIDPAGKFRVYSESTLELAIEPRCLHRCLATYDRKTLAVCESHTKCSQCLLPCFNANKVINEGDNFKNHDSETSKESDERCDNFCDSAAEKTVFDVNLKVQRESCIESCLFIVENYWSRSNMECPSPLDVATFDPRGRQKCPKDSECLYDVNCRKRTQKCCPSVFGSLYCVNIPEEKAYIRNISQNAKSEAEVQDITGITEHVVESGDLQGPDHVQIMDNKDLQEPDHFFINFKTSVTKRSGRKSVLVSYDFDPTKYNLTSKITVVALFTWRSHLNFKDDVINYVFHDASTFNVHEFNVELEPGWQYKFKLGVYDSDGLLGSKLDDLKHVKAALENPIDLNVVENLRLETMECKLMLDKFHRCKFRFNLITNRTDSSHPMKYDLTLHSCGKYNNQSMSLLQKDNKKMNATFDMSVCDSKFIASVIVKTKTFNAQGGSSDFISDPQVFNFGLKINERCHRSYHSENIDLNHLKFDGKFGELRHVKFDVDKIAIDELASGTSYDMIFVSAASVFCTCLSDEALHELSFYFRLEEIENAQFSLSERCAYQIAVTLTRSSDLNNCRQISKHILVSPVTDKTHHISDEVSLQLLSNKFPSNIKNPLSFPGKMEIEFWSLNESKPVYSTSLNNTLMPFTQVPFPRRCSDKMFVLIRHEEDKTKEAFPNCASAAYDFDSSDWCLKDGDYFKLMSFYNSRQLLIEPCLNPVAMITLFVVMFRFFL